MKYLSMMMVGLLVIGFAESRAQVYPPTLDVPVTFYDFHSNGSNPEFETPSYRSGATKGMVNRVLGPDRKPREGSVIYYSKYLKYWYRAFADSADDDYTRPQYNSSGQLVVDPPQTVGYDTSFINIQIDTILTFDHIGGGVYQFFDNTFFPLDGRGYREEGKSHNYSFSMELHWTFTKTAAAQTFRFTGDDDVWVFIDDTLRMDLGGVHGAVDSTFNLNDIPGLVNGQEYSLDFFYAERRTVASQIRITTNIISAEPSKIILMAEPDSNICAGDSARLRAIVTDEEGNPLDDFDGEIQWNVLYHGANNNSHLHGRTPRGDTIYFVPTVAYARDTVRATLLYNGSSITKSIVIGVDACYPESLWIEQRVPAPNDTNALRNKQELAEIIIPPTAVSGSANAILRDKYGNYVRASDSTRWRATVNPGVFDSVVVGNRNQGQGIVYKNANITVDTTGRIEARGYVPGRTIVPDDVRVRIQRIDYNALRIVVRNPLNPDSSIDISSLTISTDDDTLLIVQGRRSDNNRWEDVSGSWTISPLRLQPALPPNGPTWLFQPADTGRGRIIATSVVNTGLRDTITVIATPGGPYRLQLYPGATGAAYSDPSIPYVDSAGVNFPLYAKVFDSRGVWLRQYDVLTAPINWRIIEFPGNRNTPTGTLTRTSGHQNGFMPTVAYNEVYLTATFNGSGRSFSDSVRVRIVPGPPDHITIQSDTSATGRDLARLDMLSNETEALLYAIVRDRFENFIEFVQGPQWWSRDTAIVYAEPTPTGGSIGEGVVTRNADYVSQTWVYASTSDGVLTDSLIVALTDITYDMLRIYILDGGKRIIDTVRIRTDETVTLYVEGRRSDGMGWDNISATWTKSSSLSTVDSAPSWSDNWPVTPNAAGTGHIKVARSGAVPDSVVAIFLPGLPGRTRLYRRTGNPATAGPYRELPQVDTLTAGVTAPFIAKIFDRNNVWLSDYENSSRDNLFAWTVTLVDGLNPPDTLNRRIGYNVSMFPTQAYNTYQVSVTFTEGSRVFSASALVYVKPGAVDHLVIEGSPNPTGAALRNDNPLSTVEFGSRDTVKNAYAVLRDPFGNYISASTSTDWTSVNTGIVTAAEGLAIIGEGKITRTGTLGSTKVVAVNTGNTSLFDTVDVVLSQFSYDSLRIVVQDSIRIEYLVMRSDEDTVLQVIGKRSFDGIWVPVTGDWAYTSNNGSQTAPSLNAWNFIPADTGSGIIVVTRGSAVPDTITVKINPGLPKKLELYAREGAVPNGTNPPYPGPLTSITAVAGTPFPLVAKILDHRNVWLPEYEQNPDMSRQIKWAVIELPPTDSSGVLDDTAGHKRSFMPIRADQPVYIVSSLQIDGNHILMDTVRLEIIPGEPRNVVIEGSFVVNRIRANPIDTAVIPSNTTTARVYAILRDSIGNFVRYSTITEWGVVDDDTTVSVRSGNVTFGEGVISRNMSEGTVRIFAVDQGTGFRDSTFVKLLSFYYTKLRIVVGTDTAADSLIMVTTADTTLRVQGLRSDSLIWVDIEGHWENTSTLKTTPEAPGWSHRWSFSPTDTGRGLIRVTIDDDDRTTPDTLQAVFLPGPPDKITPIILTPPEQRIAGEPIVIALEITNEDGPVPGEYCFDKDLGSIIIYKDTLGDGGRPRPYVLLGTDTVWLSETGDRQCFQGGRDTITTTLFYVPNTTDSLHRISVQLGDLHARTTPFILLPGELDTLVLEYQNGEPVGDTVSLVYPSGHITMYAVGYDRFGNRIGPITSDWSADSTLHPIDQALRTERIVYLSANVEDNEAGTITAVPSDSTYKDITADVFVKITGPYITLTGARTRDANGNGYLDQMILTFSRPVSFPENYDTDDLRILYSVYDFEIDSIIGMGTRTDSVWVVALKENTTSDPQTDWTPIVSIARNDAMTLDSASEVQSVDGAGPVIWSVVKTIVTVGDRTRDEVHIVFSEDVQRATGEGQSLSGSDSLTMLFYIWEAVPTSDSSFRYVLVDSMLYGIDNIQSTGSNDLTFRVLNGVDIAPRNRISIKMILADGDTIAYITDAVEPPNLPEYNNQKVPIKIVGAAPIIQAAPNPTRPTATHSKTPGELLLEHNPDAKRWVYEEGAGVLIRFTITLPNVDSILQRDSTFNPDSVKLPAVLKIYDFVGNQVNSAETRDLFAKLPGDVRKGKASVYDIDVFWSGFNKGGMPVAPGIYRLVLRTDSNHPAYRRKEPYIVTVGIRH